MAGARAVRGRGQGAHVARACFVLAGIVLASVSFGGCRSMNQYEPLLDPVSHLDVRLDPCPQSPNCVSSQAWDPGQRVAAIAFAGDADEAIVRFVALLEAESGATVVERRGIYLHAEFRSRLFRFVDDFELLADEEQGVLQVRSASRRGWSDLGANRRRVERMRRAFGTPLVPIQ